MLLIVWGTGGMILTVWSTGGMDDIDNEECWWDDIDIMEYWWNDIDSMEYWRIDTGKGKSKAFPVQSWIGPAGFRMFRLPDFKTVGT